MWKSLPQDFVTIQLVDSREEWRSKWKKNPLEVINYPFLEVSDEAKIQSVWRGYDAPCACSVVVKSVDTVSVI